MRDDYVRVEARGPPKRHIKPFVLIPRRLKRLGGGHAAGTASPEDYRKVEFTSTEGRRNSPLLLITRRHAQLRQASSGRSLEQENQCAYYTASTTGDHNTLCSGRSCIQQACRYDRLPQRVCAVGSPPSSGSETVYSPPVAFTQVRRRCCKCCGCWQPGNQVQRYHPSYLHCLTAHFCNAARAPICRD